MKWKLPQHLRSFFREILIVIAGILIAFSLNSWWQNLRDNQERKTLFKDLQVLYSRNLDGLNRAIGVHASVRNQTSLLLAKLSSDIRPGLVQVNDTLLNTTLICATYDPSTGTINSIINSGRLELIDNEELVTQLTSLNGVVEDAREDEIYALNFTEDHYLPYLRKRIDLSFYGKGLWSIVGDSVRYHVDPVPVSIENTTELRNLLTQRRYRLGVILGALERVRGRHKETLSLLDSLLQD